MDIVERLRDYADGLSGYAADMMGEAADEIERLREDKLDALAAVESENAFYQMEIERLRREREIFSQALDDANEWGGELYADNERLREALRKIEQSDTCGCQGECDNMQEIARAALKEGE